MKAIFTFLFITIIVTVNASFSYCDDFQNEIEKLVAISEKAAVFHKDASEMMLGLNNTKKAMEYSEFFTQVVVPFRNEIEWLIDLAKIKQCIKWEDVNKKNYYLYILTHRIKEVEKDVRFRIKITNILLANTTIPNLLRIMEKFKENMRNSLSVLNTLADVKDVGSSR